MIHQMASDLAAYLSQNGGQQEKQRVYAYGIECFLNELISDIFLLACGIILHKVIFLVIWCVSFTFIRINLGIFHASTNLRCILFGTCIGVFSIYAGNVFCGFYPLMAIFSIGFALFMAVRFAPIVHENHPVSEERKRAARIKAIVFTVLEGFVGFFIAPIVPEYSSAVFTGILMASLMALVAVVIQGG